MADISISQAEADDLIAMEKRCTDRNPDGEEIPYPHLHVYKKGLADK